jgi:hypothetical protein
LVMRNTGQPLNCFYPTVRLTDHESHPGKPVTA